ncbi:hypothetical protein D3C86_1899100 [compost metagenome]
MRAPHREARADHGDARGAGEYIERLFGIRLHGKQHLALGQSHFAPLAIEAHLDLGGGVQPQRAAVGKLDLLLLAARSGQRLRERGLALPRRPAVPAAAHHAERQRGGRGLRHETADKIEHPAAPAR